MALYELQKIDSKIDEINKVKGELPLEVQDLEDEMTGLRTRIDNINAEIEELNTLTKQRKREVDQAKILIGNYKEQQNNVRNNREFDAITKEIEYQELEIELAEKRLKEYSAGVKAKKLQLEEAEYNLIRFPQRGVCLFKCGNERYLLEVHAPAYKEALFGTAGGR